MKTNRFGNYILECSFILNLNKSDKILTNINRYKSI